MTKATKQAKYVWRMLSTSERNELGDSLVLGYFDDYIYVYAEMLNEEPSPGFKYQISKIWFDWELDQGTSPAGWGTITS